MRRLSLPFGPLDTSTRDAALPGPPEASLRLRHAQGVVPDPAGSGYVVPGSPETIYTPPASRTIIAAAWLFAPEVTALSPQDQAARTSAALDRLRAPTGAPTVVPQLVVVTDADIRLVNPATGAAVALHVFGEADAGRTAQFTPLGDALYVATERGGPEGSRTPEPPLVVATIDDGAGSPTIPATVVLPFQGDGAGARPWMPPHTAVEVMSEAPSDDPAAGLDFGLYALRLAAIHRDGSHGPAGVPRPIDHRLGPGAYPYELAIGAAIGDEDVTVEGNVLVAFDDWLAHYGAAGVPVTVLTESPPGTFRSIKLRAISAAVASGDTVLTLAEPLPQGLKEGDPVLLGERARLTVATAGDLFPAGLSSADAKRLYRGVAVLLSAPLASAEDALDAPYFVIGTLKLDGTAGGPPGDDAPDSADTRSLTTEGLLARSSYREGAIAGGVRTARVAGHAGRLLFGGAAFDPPVPANGRVFNVRNLSEGHPAAGWWILGVEIETGSGLIRRWGEPFETSNGILELGESRHGGLVHYPDAQATRLLVYRRVDGEYLLDKVVSLRPSATHNAAVAATHYRLATAAEPDEPTPIPSAAERAADNAALDGSPRRLVVTGAGRPAEIRAERVFEVGASESDRVQAVVPLAEAVSEGQFGSFPLVVLCRDSLWTLGTDGEGEVVQAALYSAARGCVSPYAFVSDGRRIYYVADDGLFAVGSDTPLSTPLLAENETRPPVGARVLPAIDETAALGLFTLGARRELWLAAAGTDGDGEPVGRYVWVLETRSIDAGTPRWTTLGRDRTGFATYGAAVEAYRPLVSITPAAIVRESGGSDAPESVRLVTATLSPAGMIGHPPGLPVVLKRLGAVCDLSGPLGVDVVERGVAAAAPGERATRSETVLLSLAVAPEQAGEFHAHCRVAHVALDLVAADVRPGDRLDALEATLADRVRARRHRLILPR